VDNLSVKFISVEKSDVVGSENRFDKSNPGNSFNLHRDLRNSNTVYRESFELQNVFKIDRKSGASRLTGIENQLPRASLV
jgi:hypothetical protein